MKFSKVAASSILATLGVLLDLSSAQIKLLRLPTEPAVTGYYTWLWLIELYWPSDCISFGV